MSSAGKSIPVIPAGPIGKGRKGLLDRSSYPGVTLLSFGYGPVSATGAEFEPIICAADSPEGPFRPVPDSDLLYPVGEGSIGLGATASRVSGATKNVVKRVAYIGTKPFLQVETYATATEAAAVDVMLHSPAHAPIGASVQATAVEVGIWAYVEGAQTDLLEAALRRADLNLSQRDRNLLADLIAKKMIRSGRGQTNLQTSVRKGKKNDRAKGLPLKAAENELKQFGRELGRKPEKAEWDAAIARVASKYCPHDIGKQDFAEKVRQSMRRPKG